MPRRPALFAILAATAGVLLGCAPAASESADDRSSATPSAATPTPTPRESDAGSARVDDPELGLIPDAYRSPAATPGTLESVSYESANQPDGRTARKNATVYLPPGYEADTDRRYDVFYLQHGGGGSETSWLGSARRPTALPTILDNMIADGAIEPTIVVAPTFDTGYDSGGTAFARNVDAFTDELTHDLLPFIESRYRTHTESTDAQGLIDARDHRMFGGFSMGGITTWHMLENALDYFRYFIPMSGDSWNQEPLGGLTRTAETTAQLADAVEASGWGPRDFFVFSATGSQDFTLDNMNAMTASLRDDHGDVFVYTETGFSEGNYMYQVIDGHAHDYPWGYDYIYNALRLFSTVAAPSAR